jgi:hypothetical protein
MRFKAWLYWVNSKPLYLRWFIYFLLIRPVAEQFYNLKAVSPLVSPLYWLGILTMLFSIVGILTGKRKKSRLDDTFVLWALLVFLSVVALFFSLNKFIDYLNYAVKLTIPVLVYYFLRVFIKDKSDFIGLLTTFLLSCLFPVVSMLFGLSSGAYFSQGRFAGSYADVFNNAFYLSIGIIVLLYHYILNRTYNNTLKISNIVMVIGFVVTLIGLWVIKHIATIAVFISIIVVFIYVVARKHLQAAAFLVILSGIFIFFAGDKFYEEVINPRMEYEVEVIEGSRDIEQGVHGRMSRWTWLIGDFNSAPFYAKVAGFPLSLKHSAYMITITPHNDFLRIMFFTGYVGLTIYLILLFKVIRRIKHKDVPDRFFLYAVIVATLLYSITTVPTYYPGYVNIIMITFAYTALPRMKSVINGQA